MTEKELLSMRIKNDDGIFTPIFTYDQYFFNKETEQYEYMGVIVHKTADQVYQQWLIDRETSPTTPEDKTTILERKVEELELINGGLLLDQAQQNITINEQSSKLEEQEIVNANLLLEVAMLKQVNGGM